MLCHLALSAPTPSALRTHTLPLGVSSSGNQLRLLNMTRRLSGWSSWTEKLARSSKRAEESFLKILPEEFSFLSLKQRSLAKEE